MKKLNILCGVLIVGCLAGGAKYYQYQEANKDTTPPKIEFTKEKIKCKINDGQKKLTKGMTATDDVDGDITDHIIVSDIKLLEEYKKKKGKKLFEITYAVFDSSNNMTEATRTLQYKDYHSPRFDLKAGLIFYTNQEVNLLDYLTAEDCIDGDISGQITIDMDKEFSGENPKAGKYDFTAKVANSLGDEVELPLQFEVQDVPITEEDMQPTLHLSKYIIYMKKGKSFTAKDYLAELTIENKTYRIVDRDKFNLNDKKEVEANEDGIGYQNKKKGYNFILKDDITVNSKVKKDKRGTYTVKYTYENEENDIKAVAELMVIVE